MIIFLLALFFGFGASTAMTPQKIAEPTFAQKLHTLLSDAEENITVVRDYEAATKALFAEKPLTETHQKSLAAVVNEIKVESVTNIISAYSLLFADSHVKNKAIPNLLSADPFCAKFGQIAKLINPTRRVVEAAYYDKLIANYEEAGLPRESAQKQAIIDVSVITASKMFAQVAIEANFNLLAALTKELGTALSKNTSVLKKQKPSLTIAQSDSTFLVENKLVIAAPDIKATYTLVVDPNKQPLDQKLAYHDRVSSLFGKDFGTNQEIIAKERGLSAKKAFWATLYKCFPQEFDTYLPELTKHSVLSMPNGKQVPSLILDGSITLWETGLVIPCQYQWGFDEKSITEGKPLCYHRCAKPRDGADFSGDFGAHFPPLSSK